MRMGDIYSNLSNSRRLSALSKEAIEHYQQALRKLTLDEFPAEWATLQVSLGDFYYEHRFGKHSENLMKAISSYSNVLGVLVDESLAGDRAFVLSKLGDTYSASNNRTSLKAAINSYELALQIYVADEFPREWANTKTRLGDVYRQLQEKEDSESLEIAIQLHEEALKILTRKLYPRDRVEALFNLGVTYVASKAPSQAYKIFEEAILIVEQELDWEKWMYDVLPLARQLTSRFPNNIKARRAKEFVYLVLLDGKQARLRNKLAQDTSRLYMQMIDVCCQLAVDDSEYYLEALKYVEHNKTRSLAKLLNLQEIMKDVDFSQAVSSKSSRTCIIEWHIASSNIKAFIITQGSSLPIVYQIDSDSCNAFFEWNKKYLDLRKSDWKQKLPEFLEELSKILNIDQILALVPVTIEQLIIIPHWFLNRLPLHALPILDGTYLADRFSKGVRYAPSLQILQIARTQPRRQSISNSFLAIQNPSSDLMFAHLEVDSIRTKFSPLDCVLSGEDATTQALRNTVYPSSLQSAHYIHFACHGYFDIATPLTSHLKLADSPLFLREILALNLSQCHLVVLSACETGLTDFIDISDECIGLASGFICAGASSVVNSLWTVNDLSSTLFMIKFYENLQVDSSPTEEHITHTLSKTQTWLREMKVEQLEEELGKLQPKINALLAQSRAGQRLIFQESINQALQRYPYPFKNPYYWAPFVHI